MECVERTLGAALCISADGLRSARRKATSDCDFGVRAIDLYHLVM